MNAASATAYPSWQERAGGAARTQFFAEGMRCASCAQSISRGVGGLGGVERVDVNAATGRVSLTWNPQQLPLERVLQKIRDLGFRPVPPAGEQALAERRREQRTLIKRIGLAALGSMQIMMYTVGLYAGAVSGMDPWYLVLLRVTSMLITTPVLLYSGAPFLRGAWQDLRQRRLGMDVPVAAGLVLAFAASCYNTLARSGQVYFDSVSMFILFLLVGRYVELSIRRGSLDASEALTRSLPATVLRVRADGGHDKVPPQQLAIGDRLTIPRGAVIPVDAIMISDGALIDESLISGESLPVARAAGSAVPGGAVNAGAPLQVEVRAVLGDSLLASMLGLLQRAQGERPRIALAAERAAGWFVGSILTLAVLVAGFWLWRDPSRAFPALLSVLVVTCPCALSLATPAAVAAACSRLAKRGVLVTRSNALEHLGQIDTVVLDKTGTLTEADAQQLQVQLTGRAGHAEVLALAAALEQYSTHPLARAFQMDAHSPPIVVDAPQEHVGQGVSGLIEGREVRIGQRSFVAALGPQQGVDPGVPQDDALFLGDARGTIAIFGWRDRVRPGVDAMVGKLRAAGLTLVIASGDRAAAVQDIAAQLGIETAHGRLDPQGKIAVVRRLQQQGHRVLMIGDGINDGPVLAAADVSCAMGHGAALAQAAADLVLIGDSLGGVALSVEVARGMQRLVRSNLRWALGYNLCAVPLAAAGLIAPWMAAIGMSASSLWVVWRAGHFAGGDARSAA